MKPTDPNYWNPGDDANTPPVEEPRADQSQNVLPEPEVIAWEASEHLQHNNGTGWYVGFFVIAVVLIAFAVYFKAWTFIPVIVVMVVAAIIYVRRPPRSLHYALTTDGLAIEEALHPYGSFKSFSIIQDGMFFAVLLIPVRRFAPSTIIYFDDKDGEAIVDALGAHLPMENRDLDPLDRFLRIIRF